MGVALVLYLPKFLRQTVYYKQHFRELLQRKTATIFLLNNISKDIWLKTGKKKTKPKTKTKEEE